MKKVFNAPGHVFVLRCRCGATFFINRPRRRLGWIPRPALEHRGCSGHYTILHKEARAAVLRAQRAEEVIESD